MQTVNETACAILSLTTRLAWTKEMPQPMPRSVVRRMLQAGALEGLVLRDAPGMEEKWLERARLLLMRVSDVADGMEAYRNQGYTLLLSGCENWPASLHVLGADEPLFLYLKGNEKLLERKMISVAGSRRILARTQNAARQTGARIAEGGFTLVTGGASGTDTWALRGALEAGGKAIIVPAIPAVDVMGVPAVQAALGRGDALIVCDTLPDEAFSASKALTRNHTIYALGEGCLVVAAREGKGGSWRGAMDCMRGGWNSVYVWEEDNPDTWGSHALCKFGAKQYTLEKPFGEQFLKCCRQISLFDSPVGGAYGR